MNTDNFMVLALLGIGLLPPALLVYCALRFVRRQAWPSQRLAQALGWVALWILPAVALQQLVLVTGVGEELLGLRTSGWSLAGVLLGVSLGWWVLLGGGTVQAVFEESAEAISGQRRDTLMDNAHVYLAMTIALALLLAWPVLLRLRRGAGPRDLVLVAVGLAALANALAGISWPWWGT